MSDDPRYLRESERSLREGLRRDGGDADLHMMLARLSEYRYDWGTTSEQIRRVIELKPSGLDAPYILKATELARQGRIDEALESYRQARGINPFNPVPFVNQIVLAAMTGNARAAGEAHEGLRQIYAPREFMLIGDAWWTGRPREPAGGFGAARGGKPALPPPAPGGSPRRRWHLPSGITPGRPATWKSWLSRNRYSLESYWLLGLCRELQGDRASARADARQALQRARELAGSGRAEPLAILHRLLCRRGRRSSPGARESGPGKRGFGHGQPLSPRRGPRAPGRPVRPGRSRNAL